MRPFVRRSGLWLILGLVAQAAIWLIVRSNDAARADRARTLRQDGPVTALAFSPSGAALAVATDFQVSAWDVATKQRRRACSWNVSYSVGPFLQPNGQAWVRPAEDDRTNSLLMERGDIATGRVVGRRVRVGSMVADVRAAAVSDDGTRLAIMKWGDDARGPGTWEQRAVFEVWDTRTGRMQRRLLGEPAVIYSALALSPDGKQVAAGGQKGILSLWNVASGAASALHTGHGEDDVRVQAVAFSPDGNALASGDSAGQVWLWDLPTGTSRYSLPTSASGAICALAFSPNSKQIASGDANGYVAVRDAHHGERLHTFGGHRGTVSSLCYSLNGRRLASGGQDATAKLWTLEP